MEGFVSNYQIIYCNIREGWSIRTVANLLNLFVVAKETAEVIKIPEVIKETSQSFKMAIFCHIVKVFVQLNLAYLWIILIFTLFGKCMMK